MKVPKFPIRFTYRDQQFRAFFKPTGSVNEVKVFVQTLSPKKTIATEILKTKTGTTESWVALAQEALRHANRTNLSSPAPNQTHPQPQSPAKVLRDLPNARRPIVLAKDLKLDEAYLTWKKPNSPENNHFSRLEGAGDRPGEIAVWVLFRHLKEWKRISLPPDYPFVVHNSGESVSLPSKAKKAIKTKNSSSSAEETNQEATMPKSTKAKSSAKAESQNKNIGIKTKLNVWESWGKAFVRFGTKPDAPKLIVAHMKADFPAKPTQWAKWVNNLRAMYNRGDKKLGVKAPAKPIAPYGGKRSLPSPKPKAKVKKAVPKTKPKAKKSKKFGSRAKSAEPELVD